LGLSTTTDKQKEAAWRMEFEALGEQSVLKNVKQGATYNTGSGGVSLAFRTGPVAGPPRSTDRSVGVGALFVSMAAALIGIMGVLMALH
jgi:hypothetical protein